METLVYLNGQYLPASEAKVSVFDRGFLFADAVYEVIPYVDGQGVELEAHLERLQHSLAAIDLVCNAPWTEIFDRLAQQFDASSAAAHHGHISLSFYLQISRGADLSRRVSPSAELSPTVFVYAQPSPPPMRRNVQDIPAVSVVLMPDIRWGRCDIKSTMLLPNILARQTAMKAGAEEALLVRDGYVIEGSSSNLFCVHEGELYTPPLGEQMLGGTTRALTLTLAQALGVRVHEQAITEAFCLAADEVWITSSSRGVLPVVMVDGKSIGHGQKGAVWEQVARAYQQHLYESD
ncbi:aminotransferase class IV [Pokkaliibacter sp. CJK22405]|uniref:aminotransferase class IV n=1 Tax=Pokkaliibacter sp. CJK22405 TaxID=3384615 RepID=UPI003984E319